MELHCIEGRDIFPDRFEVIEVKGRGHPDTLSDALAEHLSQLYSRYTLERYGAILHHNFDKVGLLGGRAAVAFGAGKLIAPIRVLLNGRATRSFGAETVDVDEMLSEASRDFINRQLPKVSVADVIVLNNLSTGSSPGHVETSADALANRKHWFAPRSLEDIRELKRVTSNDTSVGCGFAPFSPTEELIISIERRLTDCARLADKPWQGTDIKIMANRVQTTLRLTMCVPQIADNVADVESYKGNLDEIRKTVEGWVFEAMPDINLSLSINTKDNFDVPELYFTATGSSIESGDEGLVGRGNRPTGLIAMARPYSMEGAAGKNPVYHVGKLYNITARMVAEELYERFGEPVEVWMISQEGRDLDDPWQVIVRAKATLPNGEVGKIIRGVMARLPNITNDLIRGRIRVF